MRKPQRARKWHEVALIIICVAAVAATALACGWPGTDHSVRFNAFRQEKDFGRLPPLPNGRNGESDRLFSWDEEMSYDPELYEEQEQDIKETDKMWEDSLTAAQEGELQRVRKLLRDYLERTAFLSESSWYDPKDRQRRRNSAIDKLDALTALDQGSPSENVRAYLEARAAYDEERPGGEAWVLVKGTLLDKNLADNGAYLWAAQYYRDGTLEQAAKSFYQIVKEYPRSEKREAALFMRAVVTMKQSKSYAQAQEFGGRSAPCSECRDDAWRAARAGFEQFIREYPRGRYTAEARGWLAYLSLGVGDRASALVEYYRLLADERNPSAQLAACISLRLVRRHADDSEMQAVEARLENEPAVALVYAYHNIYNFALAPLYGWHDDEDKSNDQELRRVAAFATRMMSRYPRSAVGGGFVLRLAQVNLELDNNTEAAGLAKRALGMGIGGEERAQALWIQGVAEHRLRQYSSARRALTALVAENPDNRLTEGARRYLAMVAEDMGDLDGALEQYLALDYRLDVAYFIDVLMTTEQLARFIDQRPAISQRDELLYALGVRYLRDRCWNEARQTLAKVRTTGRVVDDSYYYEYNRHDYYNRPHETVKERPFNPLIRGIRPQWVEQDLKTANDLERLERSVELAESDEAKAEALYQMASYQYQGTLLFYNPAAWEGERHHYLDDLDDRGNYRQPNEAQVIFRHTQAHDRAAHSLAIFLEVVHRFPNTRAARDALYTAAVCHERLREYNGYWRDIYHRGGHAGSRMVTYKDVRLTYRDYKFPRGTIGWEPATRTVDGGPGWHSPPKPVPRPSRKTRLLRFALSVMNDSIRAVNDSIRAWNRRLTYLWQWVLRVGGWLWVGFSFSSLLILWRRAADARELLRGELIHCKPHSGEEATKDAVFDFSVWFASAVSRHFYIEPRDQWERKLRDTTYKVEQLTRDARGRSVLAFNLAAHGLFIVLLLKLL